MEARNSQLPLAAEPGEERVVVRGPGTENFFEGPVVTVRTITIASDFDGGASDGASHRKEFSGRYSRRIFKSVGHNVPHEDPQDFTKVVVQLDTSTEPGVGSPTYRCRPVHAAVPRVCRNMGK